MSPVAITPPMSVDSPGLSKYDKARPSPVPSHAVNATEIPRRPSPWHEIEHSLSATSVSSRRASTSQVPFTPDPVPIDSPARSVDPPSPSPALSSSQALRDWEERLLSPASDVQRHQLVHSAAAYPLAGVQAHVLSTPSRGSPGLPPKLAAERDKEGHIEYKLKLIDPSPERFDRLVTQMMWRLKQGKNEAIYELGLADDGTVVGLTHAEMDASLRTLELMASELGATVMILREVVLSATAPSIVPRDSPGCSDPSSSAVSLSSSAYSSNDGSGGGWPVRRPDLDQHGLPRKGTKILSPGGTSVEAVVKKPSVEYVKTPLPRGKQVIFNPKDLEDGDTTEEEEEDSPGGSRRSGHAPVDDDVPPFHLDLDDSKQPTEPAPPSPHGRSSWRRRRKLKPDPVQPVDPLQTKRSDAKRLKSAQKREARRLDLLRGDGTNHLWTSRQQSTEPTDPFQDAQDDYHDTVAPVVKLPHQPARPSSLRLTSPPPDESAEQRSENDNDHDLWNLSHMPLDSLSLSFANVQIEDISPPSSPSSETEYAVPLHDHDHDDRGRSETLHIVRPPPTGEEMICVEALVVRKVQHGHGADGSDPEEEEECGWGGADDVWGLGVDDD